MSTQDKRDAATDAFVAELWERARLRKLIDDFRYRGCIHGAGPSRPAEGAS